jgi:type IV pilus assembly protein PilA
MKKILNKKGFTLIELIVVIAILAILALILVPSITGYISKATAAKNQSNARSEYSRLVLDISTNNASNQPGTTTAIVSGTAYTFGATGNQLACTATWASNVVSAFVCQVPSVNTAYWSLNNGFSGGSTQ